MKNLFIISFLTLGAFLLTADTKAQQTDNAPKLGNSAKVVNKNNSSQTTEKKQTVKLSLAEAKKKTEITNNKKKTNPDSKRKESTPKLGTMSKKEEK